VALDVKTGRFTTGTSTGDVAVTGVGFTPKAVILQMTQVTAVDTYTNGVSRCIGFLTETGGSKQVKCVATQSENAQGTSDSDHAHHTTACLIHLSIAGAIDGLAGAPAGTMLNSDGFTINISDAMPANYQVEYVCLGGSDITNALAAHKEYDAGTYTGDWTGIGFQPDLMFLMTTGSGLDAASTVDVHGKIGFGIAKSATERACVYAVDHNAAANVEGGTFLAARAIAGDRSTTNATHEFEVDLASTASWPANDGIEFTASLAGSATQNDTVIFGLFLKGTFQSKIALANTPTSNTNQDLDAGFVPKLTGVFGDSRAAHAGLNTTDADGFTLGFFDGTTQVAVTHSDNDGNTTSTTRVMQDDGRIVVMEDAGSGANPTLIGTGVASYPSGNTFRIAWTNTTGTARQIAWFALGSAGITAYEIDASPGSYTVTGVQAGTVRGYPLNAASGSYAITGSAATLLPVRLINAVPGSYAITGAAATLLTQRLLDAASGSYTLTGSDAAIVRGYPMNAESGSYTLTGSTAGLIASRILDAGPGAYAITGAPAGLVAARIIMADPGAYAVTGFNADLIYIAPGAYELNADPGSYAITGSDASLLVSHLLNAEPGVYQITGTDAALIAHRVIEASPGAYAIFGFDAALTRPGNEPTEDPILTGWIALPVSGRTGTGARGRISTPQNGGVT
jgi:hypothetical protein